MADPFHNEPNDLREELFDALDTLHSDCKLCMVDEIEKVFVARFKQAQAEAWDAGEDAGRHNELEVEPGRQLVNPYREES